jgi:hypothetical protein
LLRWNFPLLLNIRTWEQLIRDEPVQYFGELFVFDEGATVRLAPRIWNGRTLA